MSAKNLIVPMMLIAASCAMGADAPPHHCDSHHVGEFWPEPGHNQSNNVLALARAGNLQICSRSSSWRYKWEYLTVTLDRLKSQKKHSIAQRRSKSLASAD